MSAKSKGTRNEHKTLRYLEERGYRGTRSAASLGEWDLIVNNDDEIRYIQVKSNKWVYGVEKKAMEDYPLPKSDIIHKEMWRWDDYARFPRIRRFTGKDWK